MANGNVFSFKVASTLTSQRGVYLSGDNTVAYPNTVTAYAVGVTIDDVSETTQGIPVQTDGRCKLLFDDTVAAGAPVSLDASGRGTPPATTTAMIIGHAISAVSATGTIAEILIAKDYRA